MIRSCLLSLNPLVPLVFLATTLGAVAERIIPPGNLFRDPRFVREFVGSYGFNSEVEPEISPAEQRALVKIRELFGEGKFSEAEQLLVNFIQRVEAPTDPEQQPGEISPAMVFVLGNLYFSAERTDEARRAFIEALRRFPDFRRAHVNLGYLYVSEEEYDKARNHFQQAVSLGEGNPRVFGLLGYCYLLDRMPMAAENAYRQAFLLDPGNKDWKLGLAQALMLEEKLEEASTILANLIDENPEDRQLWLQQTNALLGMERKQEAAVNLEVLRMKGLAGETELNLLGNIYMDQGEPQLALLAYMAALDKAESLDIERAIRSAKILNDYGFPDKAAIFVDRVRSRGASLDDEQLNQLTLTEVRIARTAGNTERVGELLTELSKDDPANAEVMLELGRYHDDLSKQEDGEEKREFHLNEAKTHFQLALRSDEFAYDANMALAQLLVRERQYIKAMPRLEKALELKPSENLKLYVSRVQRAADREKQRLEREEEERRKLEADRAANPE